MAYNKHKAHLVDDGDDIFEVGGIVGHRIRSGRIEYLVEWKNYPGVAEQTWEPIQHLRNALQLVHEYNQQTEMAQTSVKKRATSRSRSVSRGRPAKSKASSPSKKSPAKKTPSRSRSQSRSRKTPSAKKTPAKSPKRGRSKTPQRQSTAASTKRQADKPQKATPAKPASDYTPIGRSLRSRATTSADNGTVVSSSNTYGSPAVYSTRSRSRSNRGRAWYVWRGHNLLLMLLVALAVVAALFAAFHYRANLQQAVSQLRRKWYR